ncbi:MAG: hypothetical protein ACJ762_10150 [Solirubrobacteraceae bacterium]
MGYKLLGFTVWKGAKWYLRRRVDGRKVALAGGLLALAGGGLVVALRSRGE